MKKQPQKCKKSIDSTCNCKETDDFCYKHARKRQKNSEDSDKKKYDVKTLEPLKNTKIIKAQQKLLDNKLMSDSKNLRKIIKDIEKHYQLFIEGHTRLIKQIKVTSDDKYIISSSEDNTIRIWNILENRQEYIIREFKSLRKWIITNDNKYLIAISSMDPNITVWNLVEKRKEFKFMVDLLHHIRIIGR